MKFKNYKLLLNLIALIGIAFVLHKIVFEFFGINDSTFLYSIEKLYLIFLGLSFLVFIILIKIKEVSYDNVGMSFLLSTIVKIFFCFLLLSPILQSKGIEVKMEKMNFFIIFIVFLSAETYLTIRLLDKKD
jgi:hypothetical protein